VLNKLSNRTILILGILSLLGLIELVWAASYLGTSPKPLAPSRAGGGVLLEFSPAQKILSVGDEFEVKLLLDTKNLKTSGADVLITFDPSILAVVDADGNSENGTQIRPGLLYQRYPVNEVDSQSGRIGFSAASVPPKTFGGKGVLAYLRLKALKPGVATLKIEFEKGRTDDSNVVAAQSGGRDILDKVINARYSIQE